MPRPTEWVEVDTDTAAVITATRAAESTGRRHIVTFVFASYNDSTQTGELTITAGSRVIVHHVHGSEVIPLELRGDRDTAVSAALAAGGAGVVGRISMVGYTE